MRVTQDNGPVPAPADPTTASASGETRFRRRTVERPAVLCREKSRQIHFQCFRRQVVVVLLWKVRDGKSIGVNAATPPRPWRCDYMYGSGVGRGIAVLNGLEDIFAADLLHVAE